MNFVDNVKPLVFSRAISTATTGVTNNTIIDTKGFERATIFVAAAPHTNATTSAAWTSISVREGTNSAPATVIAAASWATAASTSASNVLPTQTPQSGAVIQIDLDLKTKERFISILETGSNNTSVQNGSVTVLLSNGKQSADSTTAKATSNYGAATTAAQTVAAVTV
jgi:hypothetical protein